MNRLAAEHPDNPDMWDGDPAGLREEEARDTFALLRTTAPTRCMGDCGRLFPANQLDPDLVTCPACLPAMRMADRLLRGQEL